MSMYANLLTLTSMFTIERRIINDKNQEKLDEAIAAYWNACKLPRKKKKAARKIALGEANFWNGMIQWEKEMNPFI